MTEEQHDQDKTAIAELIARYNFAIDHDDYQGWADCFAPDGVFDGVIGKFDAHRELDRFTAEVKRLAAESPKLRHYVTNILTEVDGDTARSKCFLLLTSTTKEGGSRVAMAGEYEDRLVKHEGQWLFSYRKVHIDGALG